MKVGDEVGVLVIPGIELTTSEDIHAVCLFPTLEKALAFSDYVDQNRIHIKNKAQIYGRQVLMNEKDEEIGEIEDLMEKVRSYPCGVLYQSISQIEDSFDIEGMFEAGHTHAMLSQRIHKAVKPILGESFLHLSCGGCHLCEVCAKKTGEPCRQPENALAGLEGYGVDVYKTTMGTDLKYINGADTVTYFGMVLLSE